MKASFLITSLYANKKDRRTNRLLQLRFQYIINNLEMSLQDIEALLMGKNNIKAIVRRPPAPSTVAHTAHQRS